MEKIKNLSGQQFDQLQIKRLAKTPGLEILSISLEKGTTFPEHTSPSDAHLIVVEGCIDFHINGMRIRLENQQYYPFSKEIPHYVLARENSKFLIIR